MPRRKIEFKANYWSFEDYSLGGEEEALHIYIGGLTKENKNVLVRIVGFEPHVYVELPAKSGIKWNKDTCTKVFHYFQSTMKSNGPTSMRLVRKKKLVGNLGVNLMEFRFRTVKATRFFAKRCTGDITISELGDAVGAFPPNSFMPHEHNIDPIIKLATEKKIQLAGWLRVLELPPTEEEEGLTEEDRKFSLADIDAAVHYDDLEPFDAGVTQTRPMYCSFDLECNSVRHNTKIPDPEEEGNCVFHISMVFGRVGCKPQERKCILLSLYDLLPIEGVEVFTFKTEKALLEKFTFLIQEYNPEIFITYNGLKFDWKYLMKRSVVLQNKTKFYQMSRLVGRAANEGKANWSSSADGKQVMLFLDPVGRTNVDVVLEVERNYKLPKYSLDVSCEYFLKYFKDDMTPEQLFQINGILTQLRSKKLTLDKLEALRKKALSNITSKQKRMQEFRKRIEDEVAEKISKKELEEGRKLMQDILYQCFWLVGKHDVTPTQLFLIFQVTQEIHKLLDGKEITPRLLKAAKEMVKKLMPSIKTFGVARAFKKSLLEAKATDILEVLKKGFWLTGKYCVQDSFVTAELFEKLNLWISMEQLSNCMCVPMSYLHTRGQQIKVIAQIYRYSSAEGYIIPYNGNSSDGSDEDEEKYQGATVFEVKIGDYDNIGCGDFASLYPSMMIAHNVCYTTILGIDKEPDVPYKDIKWEDHVGCEHDPQKRKRKKADIMCRSNHFRFRKVTISPDGTKEGEGLMPRLVRNLLIERKVVKKEMAKVEARLKMNSGKATEKDIEYYKKAGYEIIQPKSLKRDEVERLELVVRVLNAKQLAIKVSANSAYGAMGARKGFIPFIPGAAVVTAMGRDTIGLAAEYLLKNYPNVEIIAGDTDSLMFNFKDCKPDESAKVFELSAQATKRITHYLRSKMAGVEEDFKIKCSDDGHSYRLDEYPRDKIAKLSDKNKIRIYTYDYCPVEFAFECVYGRYLLLTKKRYVAVKINTKGEVIEETNKGVVLTRRDNCKYLRDTYKSLVEAVRSKKSEYECLNILCTKIHDLFTRQVRDSDLIIYMGVKSVIGYAKKKEKGDVVTFLDEEGRPIKDPVGPLDPRLVYRNIPQCLLALKMLRRGEEIPDNTRLEFIYLENPYAQHQGEKAEDYTYYRENKKRQNLKPDQIHYILKQLSKPITELLLVKFKREKRIYLTPEKRFLDELGKVNEAIKYKLEKLRGINKKLEYILERATEKDVPNDVCLKRTKPLIDAAEGYRASLVLQKIKNFHGIKKTSKRKNGKEYIPNENVMQEIVEARTTYRQVVKQLDILLEPIRVEMNSKKH